MDSTTKVGPNSKYSFRSIPTLLPSTTIPRETIYSVFKEVFFISILVEFLLTSTQMIKYGILPSSHPSTTHWSAILVLVSLGFFSLFGTTIRFALKSSRVIRLPPIFIIWLYTVAASEIDKTPFEKLNCPTTGNKGLFTRSRAIEIVGGWMLNECQRVVAIKVLTWLIFGIPMLRMALELLDRRK